MKKILLATHNAGKIKELKALLSPLECLSQEDLGISCAEETGLTFIENAILKARHATQKSRLPALADDSGLVVPALLGKPGILSARFASINATSSENIEALLRAMTHLDDTDRSAYFYCALALLKHEEDPTPLIATGIWHGRIQNTQNGVEGFGYDPIFYVETHGCTAASLPLSIKNEISHRAQAFQNLRVQLFKKETTSFT
jgi:XTP/dITP diphosphohydrolase